jgi:hypothetical protein
MYAVQGDPQTRGNKVKKNYTASISRILNISFDKSVTSGSPNKSGRYTTTGYTVSQSANGDVVVSHEIETGIEYNEDSVMEMLDVYASALMVHGFNVALDQYSLPFIIVWKD